jgi:hypothetical protein
MLGKILERSRPPAPVATILATSAINDTLVHPLVSSLLALVFHPPSSPRVSFTVVGWYVHPSTMGTMAAPYDLRNLGSDATRYWPLLISWEPTAFVTNECRGSHLESGMSISGDTCARPGVVGRSLKCTRPGWPKPALGTCSIHIGGR